MKRFVFAAFAACALLLTWAAAVTFPTEVCYPEQDGGVLCKIYELPTAEAIEGISRAPLTWHETAYRYFDAEVIPHSSVHEQAYSETVEGSTTTGDAAQILAELCGEKSVETPDGFSGTARLDAASLRVTPSAYATSSRTKTLTRYYPAVSDMDTALLPPTIQEGGRTYTLQDCHWEVSTVANPYDIERTESYNATATYAVDIRSSYAKEYSYTAQYIGTLKKTTFDGYTVRALFVPEAETAAVKNPYAVLVPLVFVLACGALLCLSLFAFVPPRRRAAALVIAALVIVGCPRAQALSYTAEGAEIPLTAQPTSVEDYTPPAADLSDRSMRQAYIPPAFGSSEAYLPNRGAQLTPSGSVSPGAASSSALPVTTVPPNTDSAVNTVRFTALRAGDFYADNSIAVISIPTLGVKFGVFEGVDSKTMNQGAGHFPDTSVWDGNVCLAAHNRGVKNNFGKIHTLRVGDQISYTTAYGTRTYAVQYVARVQETETAFLAPSAENLLTLTTCVAEEPAWRYIVRAREVTT